MDETPIYAASSGGDPVCGERRQFLIAPRLHWHAALAGARPPNAAQFHAHVLRIPGVAICRQIPRHKQSHHLSMSEDEAVAHYAV